MSLAPYRKTVTAVVTGLIGWASAVVSSDPAKITASEWIFLATALATALGVYAVANVPEFDGDRKNQKGLVTFWIVFFIVCAIVGFFALLRAVF